MAVDTNSTHGATATTTTSIGGRLPGDRRCNAASPIPASARFVARIPAVPTRTTVCTQGRRRHHPNGVGLKEERTATAAAEPTSLVVPTTLVAIRSVGQETPLDAKFTGH